LNLIGDYSGETFVTTPLQGGITQIVDPPATFETVSNNTTLEISSASSDVVTFAGSSGKLQLDEAQSFAGTISGFGGYDQIDLRDIGFSANATVGYSANPAINGGFLSITDGTHTANLALIGQYTASSFVTSNDGHGGTLVGASPSLLSEVQLTQPHA